MFTEYLRIIDLSSLVKRKSVFLFGPRQTGKTFYLKRTYPDSPFYNLLLSKQFFELSQRPGIIREQLLAMNELSQPIIIDEIQKLPVLLDEVHAMIEDYGFRFILTGSSARKLKRGAFNLLAGRASVRYLYPLVSTEIPDWDLIRLINVGSLPFIYNSDDPLEDLAAYVGTYLKEEIQAEGLVRKIENFSRFLQLASLVNTQLINFSNLASDMGMPAKTIREYFYILEDTMLGALLLPYSKTKKRKAISTAKFFLFDLGVANVLAGRRGLRPKTELFGSALEHLVFLELRAFLSYGNDTRDLHFWRSRSGFEVDFLLGDNCAIEVKATELVTEKHLKGLLVLKEDLPLEKMIVVSLDEHPRKIGDVLVLPVRHFLEALWNGDI